MKGRRLLASALCVLALAACTKRSQEAVTTTVTPTTMQATTVVETTVASVTVAEAMEEYARQKGEVFERTSPATQRKYYDLMVPDQLFEYATVSGQQASFRWDNLTWQSGGVPYEIVECYVSKSGKTVLVFAKNGHSGVLLMGTEAPQTVRSSSGEIQSSKVNLVPYQNERLLRATW